MNRKSMVVIVILMLALPGCETWPLKKEELTNVSTNEALVILLVAAPIPIMSVKYHTTLTNQIYHINSKGDEGPKIYTFKTELGSTFVLNTIITGDARIAALKEEPLKIEKHGIYLYGAIVSNGSKVLLSTEQTENLLSIANSQVGKELSHLQPVNFTWPK